MGGSGRQSRPASSPMKISAALVRRLPWINVPGALLFALLQRTPAVPVALMAEEGLTAPFGAVVRSAFAAVASLGALHSLAGATQVVATQGATLTNSVNTTVGTAITPVVFVTTGSPTIALSYIITGLPPGLTVPGLNTATNILNTTNPQGAGTITGTPTVAGSYSVSIQAWEFANAQGSFSVPTRILFTIAASSASGPPTITSQPVSLTSAVGETATFTVGVTANPGASYQWKKNSVNIPNANSASYTISSVQLSDAGNYGVDVTNSFGTVTSAAAALVVNATSSPPVFSLQPVSQTVTAGATVVFAAAANGAPSPTYQWSRNGTAIATATNPTLVLTGASVIAGNYSVTVANNSNSITSNVAKLTIVSTTNPGHLSNLSVLTNLAATESSFTVATVIGPSGIAGTEPLLVRAVGPSLGQFGVAGTLLDPKLTMFQGSSTFGSNDNWGSITGLAPVFGSVGAFAFTSPASLDAALSIPTTPPGSYSVQVSGAAGQTGAVLAEIYDATAVNAFSLASPRLVNVSVLKTIPAGSLLTAGFTIAGNSSLTVLIRAVGPGLTQLGVGGILVDPQLVLFNLPGNGPATQVAANDNWGGDTSLRTAMAAVGAFALPDTASKDAVLLVTLAPGSYSAQASGVGNTGGTAIVEVYEVR